MRTAPRSTRRSTAAQPCVDNEKENRTNHGESRQESATTMPSRKARHRLSTAELARLEDVFRRETHPSRQHKKDLAAELGMDYKTVTIWFQNKRQTSKRGQPPIEGVDKNLRRSRADSYSCLRSVTSPSHNATLDAPGDRSNTVASKAILVKIKPLLDSVNTLVSMPTHSEFTKPTVVEDVPHHSWTGPSENSIASVELSRHDQMAEQEQTKEKLIKWKRIRTLEWACERQAKRLKSSREGHVGLGSEEVRDASGDPDDKRMNSALSLLSLASSTRLGPPKDVIRGASLLLNFKHSWHRK